MKAKITRPDGTVIEISGKPDAVREVVRELSPHGGLTLLPVYVPQSPTYPYWSTVPPYEHHTAPGWNGHRITCGTFLDGTSETVTS